MSGHQHLIEELAEDLRPQPRPGQIGRALLAWWVGSWLFVISATLADQPLRGGVFDQLLASPRFLVESLLGLAAGAVAMGAALRLGIPAPGAPLARSAAAWVLTALWVAGYVYGLSNPSLEPSMLGKREGCYLQVLAFAALPMLVGLVAVRRLACFDGWAAGALIGAAAGAIPGLLMQAACMYVPEHILSHHIAPVAALAVVGAAIGSRVLRRV